MHRFRDRTVKQTDKSTAGDNMTKICYSTI